MTGPTYPLVPTPPEPISGAPGFNVWETVASQYANSGIITTILQNLGGNIDPRANLKQFFDLIWNVDTARGYGLDVWGRIVGVNRQLKVVDGDWFGFKEALPGSDLFEESPDGGPLYGGGAITQIYTLSDQAYRKLILAKAASNISSGSCASINAILRMLFSGRGNAYVLEGYQAGSFFGFAEATDARGFADENGIFSSADFESGDFLTDDGWDDAPFCSGIENACMTMLYTLEFNPSELDLAIIGASGVLSKPSGVSASIWIKV